MSASPFDATFDETFQYLIPTPGNVASDACQKDGLYLTWLSPAGWAYYLFSGNADTSKAVRAVGTRMSAGISRDTQRFGAKVYTARAGGLTKRQADIISSIVEAPGGVGVYLVSDDGAGKVICTPAYVEPGNVPIWRDVDSRMNLEITFRIPERKSARA